jgi:hypothetical protein
MQEVIDRSVRPEFRSYRIIINSLGLWIQTTLRSTDSIHKAQLQTGGLSRTAPEIPRLHSFRVTSDQLRVFDSTVGDRDLGRGRRASHLES